MTEKIYRIAQKYKKRYRTSDPFRLLDEMGAAVSYRDNYVKLRGFCTILLGLKYVVISSAQPREEQRIVAAHEAGHLILHADDLADGRGMSEYTLYRTSCIQETEANLFAADFLMEDNEVMDRMQELNGDCFRVAKALYVPSDFLMFKVHSMKERGYDLKLPRELNARFLSGNDFRE